LESYKLTKLDVSNEADRNKIEDYWSHLKEEEDVVDGLKLRTSTYYKWDVWIILSIFKNDIVS